MALLAPKSPQPGVSGSFSTSADTVYTILEFNFIVPTVDKVTHSMWPEADPARREFNFAPTYFLEPDIWYFWEITASGYATVRGRYKGPAGMKTTHNVRMTPTSMAFVEFFSKESLLQHKEVHLTGGGQTFFGTTGGATATGNGSSGGSTPVTPNTAFTYEVFDPSGVVLASGSVTSPIVGGVISIELKGAEIAFIVFNERESPRNSDGVINEWPSNTTVTMAGQVKVIPAPTGQFRNIGPFTVNANSTNPFTASGTHGDGTLVEVSGSAVAGAAWSTTNIELIPPILPPRDSGGGPSGKEEFPIVLVAAGLLGLGIVLYFTQRQQTSAPVVVSG